MSHTEEHATEPKKSIHTNGSGLLLLTVAALLITLFCWNMWKDGGKEAEHYRFQKTEKAEVHHEGGEHH